MLSKQRRWQLEKEQQGLCRICGQPAVRPGLCYKHLEDNRRLNRNSYRRRHGIPLDAPVLSRRPREVVS